MPTTAARARDRSARTGCRTVDVRGKGSLVDEDTARARLRAERSEIERLLRGADVVAGLDRSSENDPESPSDRAQPLTAEGVDDAVAVGLRERLGALTRAERRLDDGTFGRSVRSGARIPDERLDADPAAELTVAEALQP